jgi:catechol 2,3-dioxygenase-like lactoylglutathione lyase family enzyme
MFRHVGIVVNDIEKQLYFYKDLLDLDILYHEIESGYFLNKILKTNKSVIDIYKLGKNNRTIVELLKYQNKDTKVKNNKSLSINGISHFAVTVSDLDFLYKKLLNEKIEFLSKPEINESKTHKVCFCRDYENNFIELVEEL